MWRVVNVERGISSHPAVGFTDVVKDATGTHFTSKKAVTDAMNTRFAGAAAACGAPPADLRLMEARLASARPRADRSLRLCKFTAAEVYRIITTRIPNKPTRDLYDVSMEVIRIAADELSPCLAELFNRCISRGVYPVAMKVSKISPLFKGRGNREDIDSYRPVSIIPAVSKIFENGLSYRLVEYLTSTDALSPRQFAYRTGHSTTSLAREVIRRVFEACERKQSVAVLCCDLSKAFDVADHNVLAVKLLRYGIAGSAHNLLTDFLRDRSQVVVGDGGKVKSDPLTTSAGVAQGSSVSNILFSLLLNDLPDCIDTGETFMYADDVVAVVTAPSIDQLEYRMNETAGQISSWFHSNGLILNTKKTHFMQFSISGQRLRNLSVAIDGVAVEQVQTTTFLGFHLDRGMTWASHIDKLCAKLGSACFALDRLSRVVSADVVRACYFATVHSVLQYGAELWGRAADRERVFRMQKRAIRAMARISRETSASPYFKSLNILTLPSIVILQVALFVRNNMEEFSKRGDSHKYSTRGAHKLEATARRLAKSDRLTHVMGPAVYNRLPESVTSAENTTIFKSRLKRWLVENVFYKIEDFLKSIQ